ncbi:hemolymph lipopolysaccharide-binding protein-like [Schistocerca cancellata]|uniref:hemolymph lipopolysaccharide-binding protein-like n=1 Tax=Schistocerca cancellata TaxID=274614 RepID=UPI00211887F3|nr:hemolymph lipopolysaccharide-binding protein-like [Schistocerca cancellata]
MVNCNYVVLVISYILLNVHPFKANACQESSTSFSISTRRNITGHWYSEVVMDLGNDEETDEDKKQTGPWNLGMSFHRKRCDGKESLSIVTAIRVPPPKPGPGYEYFAGVGYYKIHTTLKTWSDARKTCADEGGHLLILNSDAEASVAKQLFSRHKQISAWAFIGFHDKITEGTYITVFGEPLQTTAYTKWGKGQPDNAGGSKTNEGEDCGSIAHDSTLNDLPCGFKAPFICEYDL